MNQTLNMLLTLARNPICAVWSSEVGKDSKEPDCNQMVLGLPMWLAPHVETDKST